MFLQVCKIKTIPSASETASKQIHSTTTAVHESLSVNFCWMLDLFFLDQRGLFHGYSFLFLICLVKFSEGSLWRAIGEDPEFSAPWEAI